MANLPETPQFPDGIYQIETTDPVVGGAPNLAGGQGISNVPAQQLADRTRYLKDAVEAVPASIKGGVPANLDTLAKLATAIANDPNYATSVAALLATKAPLASPAFSGSPTAPTQVTSNESTRIATTAYVAAKVAERIAATVSGAPGTLDTLNELAAALGDDPNFATTITALIGGKLAKTANLSDLANVSAALANLGLDDVVHQPALTSALAAKAPLVSPAFTGSPTVPTQAAGNSTTRIASTAFVTAAVDASAAGMISPDADYHAVASPAGNTSYHNARAHFIIVQVVAKGTSTVPVDVEVSPNNVAWTQRAMLPADRSAGGTIFSPVTATFVVPAGHYYRVAGAVSITSWNEVY